MEADGVVISLDVVTRDMSKKRRLANKMNALKSTGPKTAKGKARSRLNATKHGDMLWYVAVTKIAADSSS